MNTKSSTVLVEYVGAKDSETDHLYGTGIVWTGKGDVQEVPAANWSRMKKHVDVWREVADDAPAGGLQQASANSGQKEGNDKPTMPPGNPDGLDGKSKQELHDIAKERNVIVHPNAGPAKIIEALRAAANGG